MSKSYIAKLEGKVVGKRTTKDRSYTHAVVVCPSVEYHRKAAYDYRSDATDKSNFNYYVAIAEGRSRFTHTQNEVVEASVKVDGGFDAYVERVKARLIAYFEADLAKGKFEPYVSTWCGRFDLANTAMRRLRGPRNDRVIVVPAELVVKPSTKRLAKALNESGVFAPFTCVPGKK